MVRSKCSMNDTIYSSHDGIQIIKLNRFHIHVSSAWLPSHWCKEIKIIQLSLFHLNQIKETDISILCFFILGHQLLIKSNQENRQCINLKCLPSFSNLNWIKPNQENRHSINLKCFTWSIKSLSNQTKSSWIVLPGSSPWLPSGPVSTWIIVPS